MPEEFGTIRRVTQLELESFGKLVANAEEGEGEREALSSSEIREREMSARIALQGKLEAGELPFWADTYHRLIEAGWKWRVAAYVAWASTPKRGRWPQTQDQLAKE